MNQLVGDFPVNFLSNGYQPACVAETGLLSLRAHAELPVKLKASDLFHSSGAGLSVTATYDQDMTDAIFSNITGDLKSLQILSADRFWPIGQGSHYYMPSGIRETILDFAEWRNPPPLAMKTPIVPIWSESTSTDLGYPTSEGSTQTEFSTLLMEEQLVNYIRGLVHETADEVFFDGMESVLSHRLTVAVETFGEIAVQAIERFLSFDRVDVEAVGEILRQMGSMEDPATHRSRLTTLINQLQSTDPRIRDAASLGLAALDDSAAISAIERALDQESSSQLRRNLRLVMDQLQSAQWQNS